MSGIICRECGGYGCQACNNSGYSQLHHITEESADEHKLAETVPMPLGKILPCLIGSYNHNAEDTPDWMIVLCPNCNSDHVCCLDPEHNRDLDEPAGRWFCISCYDSWEYKREH